MLNTIERHESKDGVILIVVENEVNYFFAALAFFLMSPFPVDVLMFCWYVFAQLYVRAKGTSLVHARA